MEFPKKTKLPDFNIHRKLIHFRRNAQFRQRRKLFDENSDRIIRQATVKNSNSTEIEFGTLQCRFRRIIIFQSSRKIPGNDRHNRVNNCKIFL